MFILKKKKMRNTLKRMRNTLKFFFFKKKLFIPLSSKKKINRASPQKSPTSILNVKETQSKKIITQQMVNRKANPRILSKKKKKKKTKTQYTQITQLETSDH